VICTLALSAAARATTLNKRGIRRFIIAIPYACAATGVAASISFRCFRL